MSARKSATNVWWNVSLAGGIFGLTSSLGLWIASHPLIVIADSDLGVGAYNRRKIAAILVVEFLVYIIATLVAKLNVALCCILLWALLVGSIAFRTGENDAWCQEAHLFLATLTGVLLAAICGGVHFRFTTLRSWMRVAVFAGIFFCAYRQTIYTSGLRPHAVNEAKWGNYRIPDSDKTMGILLPLAPNNAIESGSNALFGTASRDGTCKIHADEQNRCWLAREGQKLLIYQGDPAERVAILAISADNNLIVGAVNSGKGTGERVAAWKVVVESKGSAARLEEEIGWRPAEYYRCYALAVAPDNDTLVLSSPSGIDFVSAKSGNRIRHFEPAGVDPKKAAFGYAGAVAVSSDGRYLATRESDRVRIWHWDTLNEYRSFPFDGYGPLAFSDDSTRLTAANYERQVTWIVSHRWWLWGILVVGCAMITSYTAVPERFRPLKGAKD